MMMKVLRLFILYRLPLGILLILAGIAINIFEGIGYAWLLYLTGIIFIAMHFLLGTLRLVQQAIQDGDPELALMYMNKIKYPQLLFKPIRSSYYFLQSNMAMVNKDLDKAEINIRKSINTKSSMMSEYQGMSYIQLGNISLQKGDMKSARSNFMEALRLGLPDKENKAVCFLQLASIEIQRRNFRQGKDYFKKAKALNPKSPEIASQVKDMEKYMARLPG
jgi:tetratricopeptide (TPR) repeat protein